MSTLIVGAGLCGLWLAHELKKIGCSVAVFEKSRGVGGRLATRRIGDAKFDHGAQFYSLKSAIQDAHNLWTEEGLVKLWFEREGVQHFSARAGMTALAKSLAQNLDIQLTQKVVGLERQGDGWTVKLEDGEVATGREIILTCPLPQSLALLEASEIKYDPALAKIGYAKALVALIENLDGGDFSLGSHGYRERINDGIFSIADQRTKGTSQTAAWTVTMTPEFSERHFEKDDAEIINLIREEIAKFKPGVNDHGWQLKKWRFSHPTSIYAEAYANPVSGVYLAGDAFAAPSLNGAIRSAETLFKHLIESREK